MDLYLCRMRIELMYMFAGSFPAIWIPILPCECISPVIPFTCLASPVTLVIQKFYVFSPLRSSFSAVTYPDFLP